MNRRMDQNIRELLKDLDRYIQENWIAPLDEESAGAEASVREESSPGSGLPKRISLSDLPALPKKDDYGFFTKDSYDLEMKVSSMRLDALLGEVGKTFHEVLFQRIARSGMSDVEVYKRANIDRKLFSKIRANPAYHPRKNTVLALAIALRMNLEETQDLLSRAEYALSPSSKADVIIRYFIEHGMYDIDLINVVLYDYGLAVLG